MSRPPPPANYGWEKRIVILQAGIWTWDTTHKDLAATPRFKVGDWDNNTIPPVSFFAYNRIKNCLLTSSRVGKWIRTGTIEEAR